MDSFYAPLKTTINNILVIQGWGNTITQDDIPDPSETADLPHWFEWFKQFESFKLGEKAYKSTSIESGSTGPVSYSNFMTREQTAVPFWDAEMEQLAKASQADNESLFVAIANEMDWSSRSAEDHIRAIQLALSVGTHLTARRMAMEGGKRFPDHPDIAKHAIILAPVKTIRSDLPAKPGIAKNMYWLKEHRDEYHGGWVALKDGKLLASARAFQDLKQQVGTLKNSDILVTRVY